MYILLKIEGGRGRKREGIISRENNKARFLHMNRMSGIRASERMTEKKCRSSPAFYGSPNMAVMLQGEWRLFCLKL